MEEWLHQTVQFVVVKNLDLLKSKKLVAEEQEYLYVKFI